MKLEGLLFRYEIQNGGYGRTLWEKCFKTLAFFSETTWTIETKLPRNDHWKVLYNLSVLYANLKSKMAATAGYTLTLDTMGKCSNVFFSETTSMIKAKLYMNVHWMVLYKQSESRLDNGVVSINLSRTFFTGIGHVLEYIDQVLKIHSF